MALLISVAEQLLVRWMHRTYISGIERGLRNPTVLVLEEIASALGVPSARLLEDVPRKWARR
jgi:transcriptional regulator with XRE-family HTH domain